MAFGINKSRLSPIAIDFGVDTLKLLQISTTDDTTQLIGAASVVIPESARKDSVARYTFLGDALRELVRQQPFKGKRVMCAIPAFQTFVSSIELQCGADENIEQQVSLHLQTTMDMDPSRVVTRSMHVGSVVREGATRQRVVCMAAKRAVVMRYLEIAAAAKLECVGMHSEPLCVAKGFSELYNRREEDMLEARCFIDIGAATTKLAIIRGNKLLLARNIPVSGDEMTRRVARELKIDFDMARERRIAQAASFASANSGKSTAVAGSATAVATRPQSGGGYDPMRREQNRVDVPDQTIELDDTMDTLIDALRLTVRYHDSVCPDMPIQRMVLLGGEAYQGSIAEAIAQSMGIPTYIGDPLARVMRTPGLVPVGVELNQPQPGWAVPLGLCLSEANL